MKQWILMGVALLLATSCYQTSDSNIDERTTTGSTASQELVWPDGTPVENECNVNGDCTADVCQEALCVKGQCVVRPVAATTPCDGGQIALTDCRTAQCLPNAAGELACVAGMAPDGFACGSYPEACGGAGLCAAGACVDPCTDAMPCNVGTCGASGCTFAPANDGATCNDGNSCTVDATCLDGVCTGGTNICECAVDSDCESDVECQASKCAGNECIYFAADDGTLCDDGDSCTEAESCEAGVCRGGEDVCECRVDSDCEATTPACQVGACVDNVCEYAAVDNGTLCDDGLVYTLNDVCQDGLCAGPVVDCCQAHSFATTLALSSLLVGTTATATDALDLDGDSGTCLPEGNCADGVENEGSALADLINPLIVDGAVPAAINLGSILFDFSMVPMDGSAFVLPVFYGGLDAAGGACDYTAQSCAFLAEASNFNATCGFKYGFDNATVEAGKVTAGGNGTDIPIDMMVGDIHVQFTLLDAQLAGTLTMTGNPTDTFDGILGGAISKATLHNLVDLVPDHYLPEGFTKEAVHGWVDAFPGAYDSDGDGTGDAVSVGLKIQMMTGTVSGCFSL